MYFLKFPDKQTFFQKCQEAGFTQIHPETQEELIVEGTHDYAIDEIGTIYEGGEVSINQETGEVTVISESIAISGWHVNYVGILPSSFQDYVIERPNTPHRVFAGL